MKTMLLSVSIAEASKILKDSLITISSSAIRVVSDVDCYGNVDIGENETTFVIGQGPTGWTTACGKITAITPETSEISYEFRGPFWQFLVKDSIKTHIIRTFKSYIVKPT